ncbi:PXA domain-containing protein [Schizophyllum amplum]|uniref:PXA domain-containing protein n=1 Tax=Schizophyllum amplum TaxID=97359 RepID=A0A550CN61_9AGAR|nr:PXA domain-containing protein [Auriculariopsis ampla]
MRGVGVWQNVLVIGIALVVVPHSFRLVWNPVTLVALAPLTLLAGALACVGAAIYFGHALDAKRRHSRNTLRLAARPFTFSTPAAWQAVLTRSQWSQSSPQTLPPLIPDSPEVSAAINELIGFILRDFVDQWYQGISSSPAFPAAVASIVHDSLETLLARASQIDLAALIIKRILPKITTHIEHFRQSEVALRGAGLERKLTQSEELDLMLAGRYGSEGQGTLHPAISNLSTGYTKQTEENHLRVLVERALPFILPETEAESHALALVVREIVSCSVLHPVMEMLSDPDFWNRTIDQVAGAVIQQQRLVNKVRNVLEAQSPRRAAQPSEEVQSIVPTEVITIHTDPRHFESFLRSINRCSSLLDARRLKNDILGEIRRTRMLLANHEKDDWIDGQKTEDVVAFLDRLYTAKRKVEQRIVVLGGKDDSKVPSYQEAGPKSGITLRDILRNPNSLSYFMEFMDRRQRSLLVQFWLTDAGSSQTVKEDITMIHDLYFSGPAPHPALISISRKYVDDIREFARNDGVPSAKSQRRVRRSVMLAQRQVETDMEQDFEDFERSELWFRATTDMDQGSKKIDATPVRDKHPERLVSAPLPTQVKRTRSAATLPRSESTPVPPVVAPPMSAMSMRAARKNTPVMDDLLGTPETGSSRAPLFDDPEDEEQRGEEERMDAIQAALTDILAFEQQEPMEKVSSNEDVTPDHEALYTASSHPARARKQRVLFEDDVVDEPEDLEPKNEEGEGEGEPSPVVHVGPGDLQLSYEIARLSNHMSKLEAQDTMLDAFVKKAELTGDTRELRILTQSKMTVNRELAELRFKKQQYEQQESANRLFAGRTKVTIVNQTVGEEDGKSVVRFLIEVQQLALDGTFASGWVVARRYNEFLSMHNKVREKYPQTKVLDFPGKRLVTALSTNFLDTRRAALEKYLQGLIAIPPVCEGDELRTFLSRDSPFVASAPPVPTPAGKDKFSGSDLVRNVYRSVATSIDDMIFGPSMLDVLIQRLTRQAAEFAGLAGTGMTDEEAVARALRASADGAEGEAGTAAFAAPICDLILAVFELKRENNVNWLRRQAIVIILQQVLGGTVERKTRDIVKGLLEESRVMSYIRIFRDGLWPGGKLKPPSAPRSSEEKAHTRDEANRKLSSVVPDFAANMIGRSNARRGARRIFAVLQNRRLNQHIVYTVVDEVFAALFPEAQGERQTS